MELDELEPLVQSREKLLSFVRRRVPDEELAEDILQSSLVKAVENLDSLKSDERLVSWFYSILRNAIADHYRRAGRLPTLQLDPALDVEEELSEEKVLCQCFEALLPLLKREYSEIIDLLDLQGQAPAAAAGHLGLSQNNLKVRHHRARRALKRRLEETCRVCAAHHCLDCTCRSEK